MRCLWFSTTCVAVLAGCGEPIPPNSTPDPPKTGTGRIARPVADLSPAPHTLVRIAPKVQLAPEPSVPLPKLEHIRSQVCSLGTREGCPTPRVIGTVRSEIADLMSYGEFVLPVFENILGDPLSGPEEISGTCDMIELMKIDRRRFVALAVRRLKATDAGVSVNHRSKDNEYDSRMIDRAELARYQTFAVERVKESLDYLLQIAGDERDASVLLPVLTSSQRDSSLRRCAAEALAKIGGKAELEAWDKWLAAQNLNDPYIMRIKMLRNELNERLKLYPVPKSQIN